MSGSVRAMRTILSATSVPRSGSRARYTSPIAPRPRKSRSSKRPTVCWWISTSAPPSGTARRGGRSNWRRGRSSRRPDRLLAGELAEGVPAEVLLRIRFGRQQDAGAAVVLDPILHQPGLRLVADLDARPREVGEPAVFEDQVLEEERRRLVRHEHAAARVVVDRAEADGRAVAPGDLDPGDRGARDLDILDVHLR